MNPFSLLLVALGIGLMIIGFRGHQDNLVSAITGHEWGSTTLTTPADQAIEGSASLFGGLAGPIVSGHEVQP